MFSIQYWVQVICDSYLKPWRMMCLYTLWVIIRGRRAVLEIILAAKTSRVGPSARATCGEAANHRFPNCTSRCDNLIALGMRALIPPIRCHSRLNQSRLFFVLSRRPLASVGAERVSLQNGPHYPVQQPLSLLQRHEYRSISLQRDDPTIYALSTASGKAAIAVIRVSGSACRQVQLLHIKINLQD
jgi:hypothetical protein